MQDTPGASDRCGAGAAPIWVPSSRELDDLEMLLLGGYAPLRGFLGPEDVAAVAVEGRLVDGSPWPVAVTLVVAVERTRAAAGAGHRLGLLDEEGTPVAELTVERSWPVDADRQGVAGPVRPVEPLARGSHRSLRRPATDRADGRVLGVPLDAPLHLPQVAALRIAVRALGARVLLLPLTGYGSPQSMDGPALIRACLGVAELLAAEVVPVAVPDHGDAERQRILGALVAGAYGATHVPGPLRRVRGMPTVIDLPPVAFDRRTGEWSSVTCVPIAHRGIAPGEVDRLVRHRVMRGEPVPPGMTCRTVLREVARAYRTGGGSGFTVLFTGLSGSGKSTIAKAVHAALLERTDRTVTLLDGDIVRRMLSCELGFSRHHRALNVRRIGYVAAEMTRHGGIALCAPIAPYADTRAEVRAMVEAHGGFLLVHVCTPLEVCEARDRKGLYAKARAGLIKEFTGISDPYEAPVDADLAIDTSRISVETATEQVIAAAIARGWLIS